MSDLPKGWIKTKLGEVSEINMGQSPSGTATNSNGQGIPLVGGASDFEEDILTPTRYTSAPTKICQPNDLILCIRATIGKLALAKGSYCLGRGVAGIRSDSTKINSHWLCYALIKDAVELDKAGTGSTFRSISKETIFSWIISLPPLNEQRRIVAKLDTLFSHTRKAREELDRIPDLIKRYKQAVLSAAFRGDLTEDWREHELHSLTAKDFLIEVGIKSADVSNLLTLPNGWTWVLASELCSIKSGVALGKKRAHGSQLVELPYLRVANVQRGWLDLSEIKTILVTPREAEALYLMSGDILMNEGGDRDKLGRGWIWDGQIEKCIHQNHVFRLRLKSNKVLPHYVSYYANEFGQKYFMDEGKQTTNLASISMSKLSNFPIPIAHPEEMKLIIKRIEEKFKAIEQMDAQYQKASKLLDRLEQATLSKAFRGELVPQDPNDEPASVLLERILAEKQPKKKAEPRK